ncbi:glycoside hydrolase family 30 protein [Paenibacillus harenae]|uniref:glycoside hydrolase family 30 protein n=1 Tax=Paenibacillus harenae TaxID=306543 RepID=UPI00040FB226|nr:glycoside hydrolase family 30 beta sandwich domain-containing protein [Paenibacillus harenae]
MRNFAKFILIICLIVGLAACGTEEKYVSVRVWLTTPDKSRLLERQADLSFGPGGSDNETAVDIDEAQAYQTMDGFGASMTDASAWLIANRLAPERRDELMAKLFDRTEGIGISYLRVPMGASDFSLSHYSYDDLPAGESDPELKRFSIKHDEAYIIPTLLQARKMNPDLKLMGSPWSAPGWMKTSDSLIGGSLKNEYSGTYANYFVKFIQTYEAAGLPVDAVTPQNEPHHVPADYPGMRMEAVQQAEWIKHDLGPALSNAGLDTKIVIWDHNWDEAYYPMTVLNDPEASRYIAGTAFHGYAGEVSSQSKVKEAYPDKDIYFTESSGGAWAPNFGDNLKWDMQNLIIGATRHFARTVLKWNLALDEKGGPRTGGCQDCRGVVTIDSATGAYTLNEEYYAFGHASKFVAPGARRIESTGLEPGSIENVAFQNPDGSIVLVAFNSADAEKTFVVRWKGESFRATLPAGAAATYVWSPPSGAK